MKIATVYTNTNAGLIDSVESAVREASDKKDIQFFIQSNPEVLECVIEHGGVSEKSTQDVYKMFFNAVQQEADIIYNICSSVGDIASSAKAVFDDMGIPLVKIDEAMADYAVSKHSKIGVIATLSTTLNPTKRQIHASAKKAGTEIVIFEQVVDAFGKPQHELENLLIEAAKVLASKVDIIILAQASMAKAEQIICDAVGIEVVSSPKFGAQHLCEEIKKIEK